MSGMTMWMNLDQMPARHSMFTLFLTDAAPGTPEPEVVVEEVDVVCPAGSTVADVCAAAKGALAGYTEPIRVIGIANQTDGYLVAQALDGDLRDR